MELYFPTSGFQKMIKSKIRVYFFNLFKETSIVGSALVCLKHKTEMEYLGD